MSSFLIAASFASACVSLQSPAGASAPVASPAPVQPAQPAPVQPAVQPAQPAPVQPAQPTPVQPAQPAPVQPAQPAPVQPAQPAPVAPAPAPSPAPVAQPTNSAPTTNEGEPPPDYGPFFAGRAPSDTVFSSGRHPDKPPFLSIGGGQFCFIEDAACRISLLASAHVAAGVHVPRGDIGVSLPYTQFGFRGGLTARPVTMIRNRWHPWAVGMVAGWSRGSGTVGNPTSLSPGGTDRATAHVDQLRLALINQLWLSSKRHAFHLDFTLGAMRGPVTDITGFYWGTHAEVAAGFGGWGALFAAGNFLDGDTHITFGMRAHALPAAPVAALVILGMLAGGALSGGGM